MVRRSTRRGPAVRRDLCGHGCSLVLRAAILTCHHCGKDHLLQFEPRDQFEQRQRKLEQIVALGHDPFPHEFRWTHTPAQVAAGFGEAAPADLEAKKIEVRVAGRMVSYRLMGKAGFAHLQGGGKRIQI